jgi:hypothetical protein
MWLAEKLDWKGLIASERGEITVTIEQQYRFLK